MQVFSRFGGDLDEQTVKELKYGEGLMMLLRQENHSPMGLSEQVITLICAQERIFINVPPKEIKRFQRDLLDYFERRHSALCLRIDHAEKFSEEIKKEIVDAAKVYLKEHHIG